MALNDRLARLKRLSPATLPKVVARRLASAGRGVMERALYTPAGPRRPAPARAVASLGIFHPSVFRPEFGAAFRARFPGDADALVSAARRAADLSVDLFGKAVDLKAHFDAGRIPWHADVFSGGRWDPKTWFGDIRWGEGSDIRVPWELSRCGHFLTLGQAYVLTGDEAHARAFASQLGDWIDRNPPKYGVNWVCAMDVALRACNWLAAWELFSGSPSLTSDLRRKFSASLWEHGRHVAGHLEWAGEVSTNHYLSDLLGLWYIGRALNHGAWSRFAAQELTRGILAQTYADGLDYEGATAYHRLVLEIFFYFARLAPREDLGAPFLERLRGMFDIAAAVAGPVGRTPLIGDNDSARVHLLRHREDADMAYLDRFGALFFGRAATSAPASEAAWLFGCEAAGAAAAATPPNAGRRPGASGLAVLRGERDAAWFLATPNGTGGIGNHTHNDKLSVLLSVDGDDFLVDPGMPTYSGAPSTRNRFRSTASHSTVMIDHAEQNRFPANLFTIVDDAKVRVEEFRDGHRVAASHSGYRRLAEPVTHRRSLERLAEPLGWIIEDTLDGSGEHEALWTFVCGAGVVVTLEDGIAILRGVRGLVEIRPGPGSPQFRLEPGEVSPAYGSVLPTTFLRASWKGRCPLRVTFTLLWRAV